MNNISTAGFVLLVFPGSRIATTFFFGSINLPLKSQPSACKSQRPTSKPRVLWLLCSVRGLHATFTMTEYHSSTKTDLVVYGRINQYD